MRLGEIFKYLNSPTYDLEVVLVDNGSTDDSLKRIKSVYGDRIDTIFQIDKNRGFSGGHNTGLKNTNGDIQICLSNDVIIRGDFVKELLSLFTTGDKLLVGGSIIDWAGGWNEFGNKFVPYTEGWMIAATREGWKDLDYWDERYQPSDCEDIDLSMKALQKNYSLVSFSKQFPGYLQHIGSGTINDPGRMDRTKINRQKLLDKWKDNLSWI